MTVAEGEGKLKAFPTTCPDATVAVGLAACAADVSSQQKLASTNEIRVLGNIASRLRKIKRNRKKVRGVGKR